VWQQLVKLELFFQLCFIIRVGQRLQQRTRRDPRFGVQPGRL
jgi:hypothetical protein